MGRKGQTRRLRVLMNGNLVGFWEYGRDSSFCYDQEWIDSPPARPISLSLPLTETPSVYRGPLVEAFFDNLLPDSERMRARIQSRFGTAGTGAFDLLSEIGRDCVGALQLVPEEEEIPSITQISGEPLTEEEVAGELRRQTGEVSPFGGIDRTFRLSLAGAQEKTAFLFHEGKWHRPGGTTPTTHIFKRPLGIIGHEEIDLSQSLENEWLCLRILEKYGIPVPRCSLETFLGEKALVVERFDRRLSAGGDWWIRLPQEDFCQALGCPGARKYENHGGPGIQTIAALLNGSTRPEEDKQLFFKAQILFWLMAAIDGHAKNFSLFLLPRGRYHLTPLYDVISAYPVIGRETGLIHPRKLKMAMSLSGNRRRRYSWNTIYRRHWKETAGESGLAIPGVEALLDEIADRTPSIIRSVEDEIPGGFPEETAHGILKGMAENRDRLRD